MQVELRELRQNCCFEKFPARRLLSRSAVSSVSRFLRPRYKCFLISWTDGNREEKSNISRASRPSRTADMSRFPAARRTSSALLQTSSLSRVSLASSRAFACGRVFSKDQPSISISTTASFLQRQRPATTFKQAAEKRTHATMAAPSVKLNNGKQVCGKEGCGVLTMG